MYFSGLVVMLSVLLSRGHGFKSHRALSMIDSSMFKRSAVQATSIRLLATSNGVRKGREIDTAPTGSFVDSSRMEERIENAQKWVSYKLSDQESEKLNRALGIDAEVMEALEQGKKLEKKKQNSLLSKIKGLEETEETTKIKGFLQQNPVLCSGCGTPFQSKSPDNPGYLPKDMFQEHRRRSELTKAVQEAVKLLEMSGLDLGDPLAEQLLRKGKVSDEVILGVKALAKDSHNASQETEEMRIKSNTKGSRDSIEAARAPRKVQFNEETASYEPVVRHPQEGISEALLQPMSALELQAYNDRYAKFRRSKAPRAGAGAGPAVAVQAEGAGADASGAMRAVQSESGDDLDLQASFDQIHSSGASAATVSSTDAITPGAPQEPRNMMDVILNAHLKQMENADKVCICQRCFRLQNYGQIEESLRPGWSANELLTPERFQKLLGGIKDTPSVVLCLVDIFDLRGSILRNLKGIVGNNPLVIAANKVDLLPPDVSMLRLTNWIHAEIKQVCGYQSARADRDKTRPPMSDEELDRYLDEESGIGSAGSVGSGGSSAVSAGGEEKPSAKERKARREEREANTLRRADVHLVSCQTGMGMDKLLADLMQKAAANGKKIHVMGAANVGKSSFINRLLESAHTGKKKSKNGKNRAVTLKHTAKATVSNLPGTTLDFLKIQLPNGVVMIDTPGLLQKGQLTSKLNSDELRQIIPSREIKPVTIRMIENKCVLIGGVARVELLQGRPCFFTLFVSSDVKLHPTDSAKADDFITRHVGQLIAPPATLERYEEIGPYVSQDIEITGEGWKKSDYDIVIAGLGWVSVTGPGTFTVRVTTPQDTLVDLRPALLPYEAPLTTVKFLGGRLMRKGAVKRTVRGNSVGAVNAAVGGAGTSEIPRRAATERKKAPGKWAGKMGTSSARSGSVSPGRGAKKVNGWTAAPPREREAGTKRRNSREN